MQLHPPVSFDTFGQKKVCEPMNKQCSLAAKAFSSGKKEGISLVAGDGKCINDP